jgi:hypothetical protein
MTRGHGPSFILVQISRGVWGAEPPKPLHPAHRYPMIALNVALGRITAASFCGSG